MLVELTALVKVYIRDLNHIPVLHPHIYLWGGVTRERRTGAQCPAKRGKQKEAREYRKYNHYNSQTKKQKTKDKESLEKFREKFKTEGRLTLTNQNQEDKTDPKGAQPRGSEFTSNITSVSQEAPLLNGSRQLHLARTAWDQRKAHKSQKPPTDS